MEHTIQQTAPVPEAEQMSLQEEQSADHQLGAPAPKLYDRTVARRLLSPKDIKGLQHITGNRAVQRLLLPKSTLADTPSPLSSRLQRDENDPPAHPKICDHGR